MELLTSERVPAAPLVPSAVPFATRVAALDPPIPAVIAFVETNVLVMLAACVLILALIQALAAALAVEFALSVAPAPGASEEFATLAGVIPASHVCQLDMLARPSP